MHMTTALQAAKTNMPPNKATLHHQPTGMYRIAGKRALDLTLVLLMAPTVLVVIVLLAAVIALDGKSPFYCQNRVGRNGRVYRMWKLRSMTPNADAALKQYLADNPDARREWDANQKLRHDPRITRFGKLIRQTSLDELPQLWNVVKGEMSLVGPRPMMCEQRILYPGTEYYDMLPGITGYWQTSVRNESSFRDRAQFDAAYHRDLSVGTDIKVLLATVSVVMSATGH